MQCISNTNIESQVTQVNNLLRGSCVRASHDQVDDVASHILPPFFLLSHHLHWAQALRKEVKGEKFTKILM